MNLSEKQLKALAEFLPDCNLYYVELPKYRDGISDYHDTKAEGRDKLIWQVKIHGGSAYATYEDIEGAVHWLLSNDGQAALMDKLDYDKCDYSFEESSEYANGFNIYVYIDGLLGSVGSAHGKTRREALINAVLDTLGVAE